MRSFRQFEHLLPRGEAWRITLEKTLRKFFEGLAPNTDDAINFADLVFLDLFPETTRELAEWETQFGLPGVGTDTERRASVLAAWRAVGGQDPRYLQDVMQAAGFDVYVFEWWRYTAAYDSKSFSVAAQETQPSGIAFNAAGSKMYVTGSATNGVFEYDLATPLDVTSAVFLQSFATGQTTAGGVELSPDGIRMLVSASGGVYQYTLGTPFDVSSAALTFSLDTTALDTTIRGARFSDDGSRVLILGSDTDRVIEYILATPFDLASATFSGATLDIAPQGTTVAGLAFADAGRKMFVAFGGADDDVEEYDLNSGFTLSTASHFGQVVDVSSEDGIPNDVAIDPVTKRLFIVGLATDSVYSYETTRAPKDPNNYTVSALIGTTQCGDTGAECGELAAVCNRFLVNDPGYIVNLNLSFSGPPGIPEDPAAWPYFLYWGGAVFPSTASVPLARRSEFERLLLSICPAQQWLVTLINYTVPSGGGSPISLLI